ncbi:MAG: hypothetical protein ACRDRG_00240 [Pseudonocardiaceae bacterium]
MRGRTRRRRPRWTRWSHVYFDLRRQADDLIAGSGLEHIHVLNGVFMDGLVNAVFDHQTKTATYWGGV